MASLIEMFKQTLCVLHIIMALSAISYNCHGFSGSADYLRDIVDAFDPTICCLQETWHISSNASIFACVSKDYMYYDVSGVDESERILSGRPSGGLAILFKRSIADKVTFVDTGNRRLCACVLHCDGALPLLIVNVYMP